jgi:kinesin family protein 5
MSKESYVQKWMCVRFMHDFKLYHSLKLSVGTSWKNIYAELSRNKNLWNIVSTDNSTMSQSKIQVYSRFRPFDKSSVSNDMKEHDQKVITLPLHQRLTLIKLSHGLKSNREALHVLKEEGSWFGKKWHDIDQKRKEAEEDKENQKENSAKETDLKKSGHMSVKSAPLTADIQSVDPGTGRVVIVAPDVGMREFSFDGVFPSNSTQAQVYDRIASGLVTDVMNGCNATGIMYGQTGSGKTHTMFGPGLEMAEGKDVFTPAPKKETNGIVIRACEEIFHAVEDRRQQHNIEAEIHISYVEVYGETVSDLLLYGKRCGHAKAASQQFVLSGAAEQRVDSIEDVRRLLLLGEAQKRRAATALNDRSTRAHSIFILTLKQRRYNETPLANLDEEAPTTTTLTSKLFLADLGGSEQVKKSKVEAGKSKKHPAKETTDASDIEDSAERDRALYSTGFEMAERMREAVYINLGLLALKKCIEALNAKASYVPYQDSKLTMLLSAGLATGKTRVIVCINSDPQHITETIGTLRFGERCAMIVTDVRSNVSMLESVLQKLNSEIRTLEALIKEKEVWEVVEERRVDELAEEGTMEASIGLERKLVTVLRGAENERAMLNDLLLQRAELTGSDSVAAVLNTSGISTFGGSYDKNLSYAVKYDADKDLAAENTRFAKKINKAKMSAVVRAKGAEWKTGEDLDVSPEALERKAKVAKRNRLVYSGLSA